ncbi:uncharacterized protein LOC123306947 [Coccinella septempunctata]|uniref:uncharacterized protein LOC123306947 n=1 Tax=Coccinella septempunctata TaxID=41139 RepID=UPI001D073328|nr:uncharacterized protein LOC123306947 [Coccinella septempunctata]
MTSNLYSAVLAVGGEPDEEVNLDMTIVNVSTDQLVKYLQLYVKGEFKKTNKMLAQVLLHLERLNIGSSSASSNAPREDEELRSKHIVSIPNRRLRNNVDNRNGNLEPRIVHKTDPEYSRRFWERRKQELENSIPTLDRWRRIQHWMGKSHHKEVFSSSYKSPRKKKNIDEILNDFKIERLKRDEAKRIRLEEKNKRRKKPKRNGSRGMRRKWT